MARRTRIALAIVLVMFLGVAGLWTLQRHLVYHPGGAPPPVEEVLAGGEPVVVTTSDGLELDAWWLEAGPTAVVVLPGNAGSRADRVPLATALHELGLSVLLHDYRGYGGNPGSPTEVGLQQDGRAAVEWTRDLGGVEHVVVLGESLGAAVAVAIADEVRPDALVLRSPFTSMVAMAQDTLGPVPAFLVRDRWPSSQQIADVHAPLLVVASRADEIVPFDQSRRLYELANEPKAFVGLDDLGHNDRALLDGPRLVEAVRSFLAAHDLLPAT